MNVEYKNKILYVEVPNKLVGSKIMDFESDIIPLILCLKIKNVILNFEKTSGQVTRETRLSNCVLCNWTNAYKNNGLE